MRRRQTPGCAQDAESACSPVRPTLSAYAWSDHPRACEGGVVATAGRSVAGASARKADVGFLGARVALALETKDLFWLAGSSACANMNGRLQSCLRMIGWGGQTLEMHGDGEGLIGSADLPMIPLVAKSMPMPSSADVTPRERVMGLFDQGLRKKMTFVCADEGFGKSTALADWHRRRLDSGALSVWFTADRHDRDPERFWMNFVYAVTAALGEEAFVESKDAWGRSRHAAVWMLSNDLCAIAAREGGAEHYRRGLRHAEGVDEHRGIHAHGIGPFL